MSAMPRWRLVNLTLTYTNLVDARFTSYTCQTSLPNDEYVAFMDQKFGKDPKAYFMKPSEQLAYKYLIGIDGNLSTWWRIAEILLSRSVLLLATDYEQFYSSILKEGEHYIRIKKDMSDIIEKITWLNENPEKAKDIAENSFEFAQKIFLEGFKVIYVEHLLHKIAQAFPEMSNEEFIRDIIESTTGKTFLTIKWESINFKRKFVYALKELFYFLKSIV